MSELLDMMGDTYIALEDIAFRSIADMKSRMEGLSVYIVSSINQSKAAGYIASDDSVSSLSGGSDNNEVLSPFELANDSACLSSLSVNIEPTEIPQERRAPREKEENENGSIRPSMHYAWI